VVGRNNCTTQTTVSDFTCNRTDYCNTAHTSVKCLIHSRHVQLLRSPLAEPYGVARSVNWAKRIEGISPLNEGTSLQKRSGMARVVEGFHSFTCTSTHLSMNGMVLIYLPRRDGRLSWPRHHHGE